MSNDLNQCNFIGHLGADVDSRFMPNGNQVVRFRIAAGRQWKDKNGNKQEATEWISITAFGNLAKICADYLHKGSKIFVTGRFHTSEYEKNGEKRYSTEIIADEMQMLDRAQNNGSYSAQNGGNQGSNNQSQQQNNGSQGSNNRQGGNTGGNNRNGNNNPGVTGAQGNQSSYDGFDEDSDIPF